MGTNHGVHTIQLPPNPYGGIGITVITSGLVEWKRCPQHRDGHPRIGELREGREKSQV